MTILNRRQALISAGTVPLVACGAVSAETPQKAKFVPAPSKDGFSSLSPDEALQFLMNGNEAFLAGKDSNPPVGPERRLELAKGQAPFCAYVTCSDSRVPPELLFGRGLGELFIIRNAGNTIDTVAMGSIEYAVAVLKVPLVVVMGHQSCGAVDAARKVVTEDARFPGAIDDMINPILPAVLGVRDKDGQINLDDAVKENVRRTVNMLRKEADPIMLDPQRSGAMKVVGAYYDLDKGRVDFFDKA